MEGGGGGGGRASPLGGEDCEAREKADEGKGVEESAAVSLDVRGDVKGKGKMMDDSGAPAAQMVADEVGEVGALVCGICLADEVEDRGQLDSCDHLFCFGCIMQWAEVESRCPMCKRRFRRVQRPAAQASGRKGSLRAPRCFYIPIKDQVYHPSEEDIAQVLEPYANTVCMECHEGSDDNLLLLCDRCDMAAHTYCVGFGHRVPEGEWLCNACRAHASSESEGPGVITGAFSSGEDASEDEDFIAEIPEGTLTTIAGGGRTTRRRARSRRGGAERAANGVSRVRQVASRERRGRAPPRLGRARTAQSRRAASQARLLSNQRPLLQHLANEVAARISAESGVMGRLQHLRHFWEEYRSGTRSFTPPPPNPNLPSLRAPPVSTRGGVTTTPRRGTSPSVPGAVTRAATQPERPAEDPDVARAWELLNQARSEAGASGAVVGTSRGGQRREGGGVRGAVQALAPGVVRSIGRPPPAQGLPARTESPVRASNSGREGRLSASSSGNAAGTMSAQGVGEGGGPLRQSEAAGSRSSSSRVVQEQAANVRLPTGSARKRQREASYDELLRIAPLPPGRGQACPSSSKRLRANTTERPPPGEPSNPPPPEPPSSPAPFPVTRVSAAPEHVGPIYRTPRAFPPPRPAVLPPYPVAHVPGPQELDRPPQRPLMQPPPAGVLGASCQPPAPVPMDHREGPSAARRQEPEQRGGPGGRQAEVCLGKVGARGREVRKAGEGGLGEERGFEGRRGAEASKAAAKEVKDTLASCVRAELKAAYKGLGHDAFKTVARESTHSLLKDSAWYNVLKNGLGNVEETMAGQSCWVCQKLDASIGGSARFCKSCLQEAVRNQCSKVQGCSCLQRTQSGKLLT